MSYAALELNYIAIILAVAFVVSIAGLFWWMFRVPSFVPQQAATARRSVAALKSILVPVIQSMASERAVELACRLGEAQRAELILLYVVEVPLTLPLTASMPDQEESGHDALETAKAIVARHNLPVSVRMIPERYAWDGILRVAAEENVDAIVMSLGVKRRRTGDEIGRTTQQVLRNAPCEVIVDKAPIPV